MAPYIPTGEPMGHQEFSNRLYIEELRRLGRERMAREAPTNTKPVGRNRDLRLVELEHKPAPIAKQVRKDMRKIDRHEKHARGEATWDDGVIAIVGLFAVIAIVITLAHGTVTGHWNPLTGLSGAFGSNNNSQIEQAQKVGLERLKAQQRAEQRFMSIIDRQAKAGQPGPPGGS
jgi:Flp pilus assembly protein TadB